MWLSHWFWCVTGPLWSCLTITMRRQGGQYGGDASADSYVVAQVHHMSGQRMETNSGGFEGRLEAFTPERDDPYSNSKPEDQWRWEMDGSSMPNSMTSPVFNEGKCEMLLHACSC